MIDKEMKAYLENQLFEAKVDYLRRGRALMHVTDEELQRRWIGYLKDWAAKFGPGYDHGPRTDVEAEMQLRSLRVPFDEVREEWSTLKRASTAALAHLAEDPSRWARAEREIGERIEAFRNERAVEPH